VHVEGVGKHEAEDIRLIVEKVIRDLGNPEPPLKLDQVRDLLQLNLGYYSTAKTSLLQDVAHRVKVAGKQVLERPMLLVEAIQKAELSALWVPDTRRILIDETVPKPKHRWIEGHEIGHSLVPWHREYLFGDNEYTLDPVCHAIVEAEANYASAQLLFLQDRFALEARENELNFKTVLAMAGQFKNTLNTTFWRMVEDRDPTHPVFGMVTAHPHYLDDPKIGRDKNGNVIRYFIRSLGFRQQFPKVTPEHGYALIEAHITRGRRGPVLNATDALINTDGEQCEFKLESFCNHHAIMTFGSMTKQLQPIIGVL
tara:strand:+ start:929 stop:1864 length:936 start_codon:yes stop_codon:yes gene_type:complete